MNTIESLEELVQHIDRVRSAHSAQRLLVGVAGAPGSGKSTLAEAVVDQLNRESDQAVVVPMDGYHLDNAVLEARGHLSVKGAPHTFDVDGFVSLMTRLCRSPLESADLPIYIPVFDRKADLSRNAASIIKPSHRVIVVEGNYLLLDRRGWQDLHELFHLRVMLDVPMETLEARLIQRWLDHGHDRKQARQRARANDLPNAEVVINESMQPHLYYKSVRQ